MRINKITSDLGRYLLISVMVAFTGCDKGMVSTSAASSSTSPAIQSSSASHSVASSTNTNASNLHIMSNGYCEYYGDPSCDTYCPYNTNDPDCQMYDPNATLPYLIVKINSGDNFSYPENQDLGVFAILSMSDGSPVAQPVTFNWNVNGAPYGDGSQPNYVISALPGNLDGAYIGLDVRDGAGNTASAHSVIHVIFPTADNGGSALCSIVAGTGEQLDSYNGTFSDCANTCANDGPTHPFESCQWNGSEIGTTCNVQTADGTVLDSYQTSYSDCTNTCFNDGFGHPQQSCTWNAAELNSVCAVRGQQGGNIAIFQSDYADCRATCRSNYPSHPHETCNWGDQQYR